MTTLQSCTAESLRAVCEDVEATYSDRMPTTDHSPRNFVVVR